MKKIDMVIPCKKNMEKLLRAIDFYTKKIAKIKKDMQSGVITRIEKGIIKIQRLNLMRFQFIATYYDFYNKLLEDEREITAGLYDEAFDPDYLMATFYDEANDMSLVKNLHLPGWDLNPESENFSFNMNYYILESVGLKLNLDNIRNYMDVFVPDNDVLMQYKRGVFKLCSKKFASTAFFIENPNEVFDDLRYDLNLLFSMKSNPGDYIPLFEPVNLDEFEEQNKDENNNKGIYSDFVENSNKSAFIKNNFNKER